MRKLNKVLILILIAALTFGYAVPGAYAYGKANIDVRSSTIRSAAILTTGYVTGSAIQIDDRNQLNLLISYTKGSSTGCKIKVEVRYEDSTKWYRTQTASVDASGNVTLKDATYIRATSGNIVIDIPVSYYECRVSVLASGSGTGTSMSIVLSESTH